MKKISLLFIPFILLFNACSNGQSPDNLDWKANLEQAMAEAKKENKAVLVNFTGSDWCKWCMKLNAEVFSQPEFKEYAEKKLVLVKLDFPNSIPQSDETKLYNNNLARRYGIQGFPTILILNSTGELVAKTGYQYGGAQNYIKHIQSFL